MRAFEIDEGGGSDEEDEDKGEEEVEEDVLNLSIVSELLRALYEARFLGPALALLGLFVSYQLTIAPYQQTLADYSVQDVDLQRIRPILTVHEQAVIRVNLMNAETEFDLPSPSYDRIKLRFHPAAMTSVSHQPPEQFYQGVTFGISNVNAHKLEYTSAQDTLYSDMHEDLRSMRPRPTAVMARSARRNESGWQDTGFAVYFSYADLAEQGKLSSDKLQPWKRVVEEMLVIARNYRQVCLVAWYPHEFGRPAEEPSSGSGTRSGSSSARSGPHWSEAHMYKSMLQHVIPTRTGLEGLVSIVPVWMSAVNATAPRESPDVYVKEWSEDDHWDHYKLGGAKHIPNLPPHPRLEYFAEIAAANRARKNGEL